MSEKKSKANDRTRNWTFIVYPDSAPEDWQNILNSEHVEWIQSPLHEADVNADGEVKKPHWHVMIMYTNVKSFEQVKSRTDLINAPEPRKVASAKGLVRYMVHMDNPEKAQYKVSEIICHGGANIADLLAPTKTERYTLIGEMMDFIDENRVTQFSVMARYAREHRRDDWFPLLCDNSAFVIREYIKSVWREVCSEDGGC